MENLLNEMNEKMHILGMYGHPFKTTFWQDFTIAETCGGDKAIRDTYKRAFNEWHHDYVYFTELVMVLNWLMWYWHDHGDEDLSMLYEALWNSASDWAMENLTGEARRYYYRTID